MDEMKDRKAQLLLEAIEEFVKASVVSNSEITTVRDDNYRQRDSQYQQRRTILRAAIGKFITNEEL